jgi:aryl-alcohol dehydrogenase-like predicted oxidoreductase
MAALRHRTLGASGIEVSAFALGSWRTYERISRDRGVAVLGAARECGIDFLEIARYNDETGRAPIPTGYSEVVFGEVFRACGWPRDEVTIATKLWWEFWPRQTAREELAASLQRTGLDHFDFVYSDPPPEALALDEVVAAVGELIADGTVRAWAIVNWPAERLAAAGRIAHATGVPAPCAAQLPYSLVARDWVEGPEMTEALALCDARVVASFVLAGGALSGKYSAAGAAGRLSGALDSPRARAALGVVDGLRALANALGTTPAALAIAFALANDRVASVLFGATKPEQVRENVRAAEVASALTAEQLDALRALGGSQR